MTSQAKLHVGCFDHVIDGWVNTDVTPHLFISKIPFLPFMMFTLGFLPTKRYHQHKEGIFRNVKYLNVTNNFPWANETFSYVYTSHMLEHLYPNDALFCISEIFRVLQVGGVVRILVPDLDELIKNYDSNSPEVFLSSCFEAGQKGDKNQHHWHYNETSLKKILLAAGFREAVRCNYKQGKCADVEILDLRPESLFIEGIK